MMDLMPEASESVIEFGPDDDAAAPPRRSRTAGFLTGLAGDRRLTPITAALGALALFGSLVSEWQITDVDGTVWGDGTAGTRSLETTVADLGGWGGGYLSGLLLLTPAAVLTMFGPPAGRRYARLSALSIGGLLLAMLAALTSYLGETSRTVGQAVLSGLDPDQVAVSQGRGLSCAAVGVALVTLALYLSGRAPQPAGEPPASAEDAHPAWGRRRTGPAEPDGPPQEPFELTVSAAKPFTSAQDDRDRPS
jgi:hypothetical protein